MFRAPATMSTRDLSPFPAAAVREAFLRLDGEGREFLLQMMRSQAFRERAAVRLFEEGLAWAPSAEARARLLADRDEEEGHYTAVVDLWASCTARSRTELDTWCVSRARSPDVPRAETWLDIALAQWLYDRAGLFQLREAALLPFAPYARLAAAIVADEDAHGAHGEEALATLAAATDRALLASRFVRWLRIALLSFGRPASQAAKRALTLGWRRRAPDAIQAAFLRDIGPRVSLLGLTWPTPEALGLDISSSSFPALS